MLWVVVLYCIAGSTVWTEEASGRFGTQELPDVLCVIGMVFRREAHHVGRCGQIHRDTMSVESDCSFLPGLIGDSSSERKSR